MKIKELTKKDIELINTIFDIALYSNHCDSEYGKKKVKEITNRWMKDKTNHGLFRMASFLINKLNEKK